jgi:chromosome segregation ATPase
MNRTLPLLNLVGVLCLVVLSAFQWGAHRRTQGEATHAEAERVLLSAKFQEQARAMTGLASDLEGFREQYRAASQLARECELKTRDRDREMARLTLDCAQLRESLTNWMAAVAIRDDRLSELTAQVQSVALARNEAVERFNALAGQYNTLVQALDEARTRISAMVTNATAVGAAIVPPKPGAGTDQRK